MQNKVFFILLFSLVVLAGCGTQTEGDGAASGTETEVSSSGENQITIPTKSNSEQCR